MPIWQRRLACILSLVPLTAVFGQDERVEFSKHIRPILSDRCFHCHGPDEEARQANLRFDIADGEEGPFHPRDGFPAITPGDLQMSAMWQRLTATDADERMPPQDSHKPPLSSDQKALIKRWIEQGGEYDAFWAFVPPRNQTLPQPHAADWAVDRVDRFVLDRIERAGLSPQPPADRRTLIRRVTLDLTGLPPTREEILDFIEDEAPSAYSQLVDRLMASPQYGEHMTKYWLDLVRFADTNGIHHDHYREMTPYRDWVIRAFNDGLGYDDFVTFQLAGDLFETPTLDQQIASGFNRLHLVIDKGTALPAESFARNVIDRTTAVGTALMGLTVQCAVCHDHKYDPITQKDFYQLFAFFNNIDSGPETPGKSTHEPALRMPNADQQARLESTRVRIAEIDSQVKSIQQRLEDLRSVPEEASTECRDQEEAAAELVAKEQERSRLQTAASELESQIPVTLIMRERDEVRPTFVLVRGAYDQPGEQVDRGTPAFLPPLKGVGPVRTRMDLARWLVNGTHPLTARVAVNRIWQQFFGVGLVRTSEDFGTQGEWPSHPKLLDDLTQRFVASGWDIKRLVSLIVTSQTYQQSSRFESETLRADPENRLLARGTRFRLDSEVIRDQILAVSGLLESTLYGRSVKPPQPPDLWKNVSMVSSSTYSFAADDGAQIHRRSIYTFWKRALPPPQMTIFDAPTRESCIARRERTNTPLQALVLMNERQYFQAAIYLAEKLLADTQTGDEQRLRIAFEMVTSQLPDDSELQALSRGLASLREVYRNDLAAATALTAARPLDDAARIETAAHTMLVNALFNLDSSKTRE